MPKLFVSLLSGLVLLSIARPVWSAELRTYRFVPDGSLPYNASCDCSPHVGTKADLEGTFTIVLDKAAGTGSIVGLNDRFAQFFYVSSYNYGPILESADVSPELMDFGVIPPWARSSFVLPFEGKLSEHDGALILKSDGIRQTPNGQTVGVIPPYEIVMQNNRATFDMTVPIDDYFITVSNAIGELIVPEPNAFVLLFALTYFSAFNRGLIRRQRSTR